MSTVRNPVADGLAPQAGVAGGPAVGCCGSAPRGPGPTEEVAAASPCCGTAAEAKASGACCGQTAKAEAVAAGVGCCG
jgi:hypothetical protein